MISTKLGIATVREHCGDFVPVAVVVILFCMREHICDTPFLTTAAHVQVQHIFMLMLSGSDDVPTSVESRPACT